MTVYYENEAAVDAALQAAKTPDDVRKIAQDLETRMAPRHWIQKGLGLLSVYVIIQIYLAPLPMEI